MSESLTGWIGYRSGTAVRRAGEWCARVTQATSAATPSACVRRHDPAAFTELYARHVDAVYAWLRIRIDWGTSDLTTETLARAWLSCVRFRDEPDGLALPLLLGIAANLLVDAARHDRIETRTRDRLGLPVDPKSGNSGSRAVSSTPQLTQKPMPLKWIQVSCVAPPPGAGNSGQLRQQRLE